MKYILLYLLIILIMFILSYYLVTRSKFENKDEFYLTIFIASVVWPIPISILIYRIISNSVEVYLEEPIKYE